MKFGDIKIKTKLIIGNVLVTTTLLFINFVFFLDTKEEVKERIDRDLQNLNKSITEFIKFSIDVNSNKYIIDNVEELVEDIFSKESIKEKNEIIEIVKYYESRFDRIILFKGKELLYKKNDKNYGFPLKGEVTSINIDNIEKLVYLKEVLDYQFIFELDKKNLYDKINFESIKKQIDTLKFREEGYTYILNSQGKFIKHPAYEGDNIFDIKKLEKGSFAHKILEEKKGAITYYWKNPWEVEEREKLAIFNYIEPLDWYIVTSGYYSEFYNILVVIKNNILVTSIFLILFNILFFLYLHRVFEKPIKTLTEKIKNINPTNGYSYLEVRSNDELGMVTVSFNNLLLTIENYATYLESMVEEKTKELRLVNEKLYKSTIFDKLTEVHNRAYIMNKVQEKFDNNEKFTCVLFDIDYFKKVNDKYGHLGGDFILKELCKLVKDILPKDSHFGRYGGEEFLIIFRSDAKETFGLVEEVREKIEKNVFKFGKSNVKITSSFGIASTYTHTPQSMEELIDYTDKALYKSKNTGRNKVTIYSFSK